MSDLLKNISVAQKTVSDWSPTGIFLTKDSPLTSLSTPRGTVRVSRWPEMKLLLSRIHWITSVFKTSVDDSVIFYQNDRAYIRILKEMFPMIKFAEASSTRATSIYRIYDSPLKDSEMRQLKTNSLVSAIYPYYPSRAEETYHGTIVFQPFNGINDVDTQIIIDGSALEKELLKISNKWYYAAIMYYNISMRNDNDGSVTRLYRNPITLDLQSPPGIEPASSYDASYLIHVLDSYLRFALPNYSEETRDDRYVKTLSLISWLNGRLRREKSFPIVEQNKKVLLSHQTFDPSTLEVNFSADKTMPYKRVKYPVVGPTVTWGELKNLMSEMRFFNSINTTLQDMRAKKMDIILVVMGAYPGYHYLSILKMYPFLKVELWDPRFEDDTELEETVAALGPRNVKLSIHSSQLTAEKSKNYSTSKTLFVSHLSDIKNHSLWFENLSTIIREMKPVRAMIPFKLPYAPPTATVKTSELTESFKGEIFKQIFTGPENTESMLIVDPSLKIKKYNNKKYEEIMAYYNFVQRDSLGTSGVRYKNPLTKEQISEDDPFNGNYDSVAVISIIHRSLEISGDYVKQKIDLTDGKNLFSLVEKKIASIVDAFIDVGHNINLPVARKIAKLSSKDI